MTTRKKAASAEVAQTPIASNSVILPAGQLYRIQIDLPAINENAQRRRSVYTPGAVPRRLQPVVVVVDESDKVHKARSIRTLGSVAFAEVNPESLKGGVHILRGLNWMATTRDAIELIND